MGKNFDAAAWINAAPNAAPTDGQLYALLMPSKGGLSTGKLRAGEAIGLLRELHSRVALSFFTRKGVARINEEIRRSPERRAAGQQWLNGLLILADSGTAPALAPAPAPAAAPAPAVEPAPAPAPGPAPAKAEQTKRPDGKVWVTGHWRRAKPAKS